MDIFFTTLDNALRTVFAKHHAQRAYPALGINTLSLTEAERREAGALMRVNHVGEVCAQALYASQALATRIEDLSTKRLLPMEMISVVAAKIPGLIRFSRVVTDAKNLERVTIDARTDNSGEITLFKTALEALPEVAHAEISSQRNAPGSPTTTFTLTTTFKVGAVKSAVTTAP